MACKYCYHSDPKRLPFERGMMDSDFAIAVIEQAAVLGVHSLKFNYRGESTLHPHYEGITWFARKHAHDSVFIDRLANSNFKFPSTNDSIFRGLANLTKVKVSYDSFRKDVFETQRAGGNHEVTTKNIDIFYDHPARITSGTELVIQAVRTSRNADEDIEGQAKKRWPSASISIRDMVEGRVDKDLTQFRNRSRGPERIACKQAFVRLIVHHDGRVGPCCPSIRNDLFVGDLKVQSLSQVFNSSIARELRRDLKSGKAFQLDPCATCSSFESYKGYKGKWTS
jgi:radical SAM protein with 4Fe4S-binding SPASM domain